MKIHGHCELLAAGNRRAGICRHVHFASLVLLGFFLLSATFQPASAIASEEDPWQSIVSLEVKDSGAGLILKTIARQSGLKASCDDEVMFRQVSLSLKDVTVADALEKLADLARAQLIRGERTVEMVARGKPASAEISADVGSSEGDSVSVSLLFEIYALAGSTETLVGQPRIVYRNGRSEIYNRPEVVSGGVNLRLFACPRRKNGLWQVALDMTLERRLGEGIHSVRTQQDFDCAGTWEDVLRDTLGNAHYRVKMEIKEGTPNTEH